MNIYLNGVIHENYGTNNEHEIEVIGEHNFAHAIEVKEGVDYMVNNNCELHPGCYCVQEGKDEKLCKRYKPVAVALPTLSEGAVERKEEGGVRLTAEEFEALLFEVYQRGFYMGVHRKANNIDTPSPYEHALKEKFNALMYELKLKTV